MRVKLYIFQNGTQHPATNGIDLSYPLLTPFVNTNLTELYQELVNELCSKPPAQLRHRSIRLQLKAIRYSARTEAGVVMYQVGVPFLGNPRSLPAPGQIDGEYHLHFLSWFEYT
jgi:hypothetical protein